MNDTILNNLRSQFTPEYREFVESDYTSEAAVSLGLAARLTETQVTILANGFMLYLHFVLSDTELVRFLVTEGDVENTKAAELVSVFKSTLPIELTAEHDANVAEFRSDNAASPAEEIAEMEAALQQIPPVRTMATDMQIIREGGGEYRSSQDTLLQKDTPSTTPAAKDPDEDRWSGASNY